MAQGVPPRSTPGPASPAASTPAPSTPAAASGRLLPLQNGDRLTREEFERRYEAMPHLKKAELIEGVVYVPSPVNYTDHGKPHMHLITLLGVYEASTPGVEGGDNTTVRLDLDNEPQPDAFLRIAPGRGGQSRTGEEGYVEGAPELAAEVAASSASYDLHAKLHVYRRAGVREYLILRVLDQEVDWFCLRGGQFQKMAPDAQGILRSEVFPGLWLDPAALLRGDLAGVLAVLDQGVQSPEHAAFVERLRKSAAAG